LIAAADSKDPPRFRRKWGQEQAEASLQLTASSHEVRIDNNASDRCTLIEVFTFDRTGLLYELARKLHEMKLVIHHAKIGTSVDQVVDVFYVTDRQGRKVLSERRLDDLRAELFKVIAS
jgi:[protein-PII] uridylyltransferase